jgi:hypothetical protein
MKVSLINKINNYWDYLEKKFPPPRYVKTVKNLEFKDLKKNIDAKNENFIKNIIRKMYVDREAFVLKNCATKDLKKVMLDLTDKYQKTKKPSFYKMLDGVPNFHRAIDKKITKKYSLYTIKHSYYFYNWNIKTKLEKKLKEGAYSHWRYIKFLAGNSKKKYENNIPSDGQIDRLQIVRYPAGGGQLKDHVDARKNQRVVSGIVMSKRGTDYKKGGFYFKLSKSKNLNVENKIDEGDAVIFYGSLTHGVEPIDPHKKLSWKSKAGRWFLGMFVNDSDHVKNRVTSEDLSGIQKKFV